MKKWLVTCLLAIALLFVATTAMAAHIRLNGDYCEGNTFEIRKREKDYHTLYCYRCYDEFTENHWSIDTPQYKATCTKVAVCTSCLMPYGEYGPHDWGEWKSNGNGSHTRTCKNKSDHVETENCTFSTAPCAGSAACTVCGGYYSTGHDWGGWTSNGNKTHTHTCKRDPSHTETADCRNFQEANCTTPEMCLDCGGTYGETAPDKHDWQRLPKSNGDGTHTYTCDYDSTHKKTEACSSYDALSCGETGYCRNCMEEYTVSHKLDGIWASDADEHWQTCIRCNESQSKAPHSFVELADAKHLKSEATCVSGAVYYRSCSECGYHAPDTFESGDKNPNNHDLVPRGYKAPTCTEIGWKDYDTCSRCDYTTYRELDALGHAYEARTVQPTCTKAGYTLHTCTRCKASYTDAVVSSRGHWYGEWSQHSETTHTAECLRDCGKIGEAACRMLEYRLDDAVNAFCAVCGKNSAGERLAWIEDARIESDFLSQGEWIVRGNESWMTVGFEYAGELVQPETAIVRVPAALLDGKHVSYVNADGEQTELHVAFEGDEAVFALEFSAPAAILHIA